MYTNSEWNYNVPQKTSCCIIFGTTVTHTTGYRKDSYSDLTNLVQPFYPENSQTLKIMNLATVSKKISCLVTNEGFQELG